jgi:hypothetical protein
VLAAVLALVVLLGTSASLRASAALTSAQQSNTLAFLQLIAGAIPGLSSSWTGSNWCSWTYLNCTTESNITLIIDGANLTGSLPALTSNITGASVALHTIAIMNMNITNGFPDSWAALTSLSVLNFANTNIFGTLPQAWNAITGLTSVNVANSSACGNLPNWTRSTMVNLDLGGNYLRGTLPRMWSSMLSLQNVNISNNYLCGCVPETWTARVLQYAAARSLGYYSYDAKCRNTRACAAEQPCSRVRPNYSDATAAPAHAAMAALTLATVVVAAVFAM